MNNKLSYNVFIDDPIIRFFTLINAGLVIAYLWISLVHVPQYEYAFSGTFLLIPLLTVVLFKAFDASLQVTDDGTLYYTEKFLFFTIKKREASSIGFKTCKKWSQITLSSGNAMFCTRFIFRNDESRRIVSAMATLSKAKCANNLSVDANI